MEQALYKLPDGWEWRTIEEVAQIGADRGFAPTPDSEGNVPFIGMTDIDQETGQKSTYELRNFDDVKKGYTKFQRNAVLFAKITPCTENNKTALIDNVSGGFATTEVFPIHALDSIEPKYLLHFFRSPSVRRFLIDHMEGATGRQRVPLKALKSVSIPVCGLKEQKRIVDKLDALLTRIDTSIEHLQESVALADALYASTINEQMMQAIELAGLSTVEKHIEQIQTGTTPPTKQPEFYENGDINWFAPSDFGDHDILSDSNKKLSQKAFDAGKARKFDAGTIMLVAIGATIGKIGYLEQDASSNQQITGMKFNSDIIPRYAYYWFRFIKPEILTNASTATLPIINQKGIKALSFCAPNRQLQETICKKIDEVSSFRNTVKAELNEKVELMRSLKASILDSAFKGEL
ncbi:restriction endonuclease subunit S [Proteus mirabilis]|uniref:restriction endonuclease subunit S n=1 Tax=Proteus mirabilis TaxID=584 RepID=UPI001583D1D2|nr:restriction endonuclease subunit S [Proteus mirabilis]MBS3862354.1 restriction endonuclease subunit S [Proteus mirabilis]MDF7137947.1 restriction endonuclease subunit S [Proteus mirabilis]MDF7264401.1 restriction endonuclease subunit S [Proteus mirabilis]MDF7369834.1 restriction endonuclease subunit S [Proteus mirabilis]MDF7398924.1 restriction endonuclease subunit S [Proteus mirabilis]